MTKLALKLIREDGGTQSRAELCQDTIRDYAEKLRGGVALPPVDVVYDGTNYWLVDGFHRVGAAEEAKLTEIDAEVTQGTQRQAILRSLGVNATHGLPRSNATKRRAVLVMLNDEEWKQWSDVKIAENCQVGRHFVGKLRAEIAPKPPPPAEGNPAHLDPDPGESGPRLRKYVTKHGTESVMAISPPPAADPDVALAKEVEIAFERARALADTARVRPRARMFIQTALHETMQWLRRSISESAA